MTQDHAVAADSSIESLFETMMRGYNKRQVEEYIGWLRAELASAQEDSRSAHHKADDAMREVSRLREELAQTRSEAAATTARPQHEQVSERLAQILRLADEEADQKRVKAAQEADSTLEGARDQSAKVLEAARSAAEGIISAARERAEKEAAAAKSEAESLLAHAASSSQNTIDEAEARAAAVLANADQRTSQITMLQEERMTALRDVHTDTLRRLEVVRGALEKVLTAEIDAGPPDASIDPTPLPASGQAMRAADVDVNSAPAAVSRAGAAAAAQHASVGRTSRSGKRGVAAEVNLVNDGTLEDLSLQGETLRAVDYAEADEANAITGTIDRQEINKVMDVEEARRG